MDYVHDIDDNENEDFDEMLEYDQRQLDNEHDIYEYEDDGDKHDQRITCLAEE